MGTKYRDVQFPALDGILLRGQLYSGGRNRPCIVMTPGVSARQLLFANCIFRMK